MRLSYSDRLFFGAVKSNSLVSVPKNFEIPLSNRKFANSKPRLINSPYEIKLKKPELENAYKNNDISQKILEAFESRYISGGLNLLSNKDRSLLLMKIKNGVENKKQITFRLLGVPFKCPNPLKIRSSTPDLAELFFIYRLSSLSRTIKKFYPPGIKFIIVAESLAFFDIFGITCSEAINYRDKFIDFVKKLETEEYIEVVDLIETLGRVKGFNQLRVKLEKQYPPEASLLNLLPAMVLSLNVRYFSQNDLFQVFDSNLRFEVLSKEMQLIRKDILNESIEAACKYFAFHETRKRLYTSSVSFPDAIPCSVVPKVGSLTILPIDKGLFPHHGVGVLFKDGSISVRYEIDMLRNSKLRPVIIKNQLGPFYYEEI